MSANDRQVGGSHYQNEIQHWDFAAANDFDYFQGVITKYVTRWRKKGGIEDLKKAQHYLEKYIEVEEAKLQQQRPPPHPSHDWLEDSKDTHCVNCGAYRHLPSGIHPCHPGDVPF